MQDDVQLYCQISQFILSTSGYPRRLEAMLTAMKEFQYPKERLDLIRDSYCGKQAGRDFIDGLHQWLNNTEVQRDIADATVRVPFPGSLDRLQRAGPISDVIESLTTSCAARF